MSEESLLQVGRAGQRVLATMIWGHMAGSGTCLKHEADTARRGSIIIPRCWPLDKPSRDA